MAKRAASRGADSSCSTRSAITAPPESLLGLAAPAWAKAWAWRLRRRAEASASSLGVTSAAGLPGDPRPHGRPPTPSRLRAPNARASAAPPIQATMTIRGGARSVGPPRPRRQGWPRAVRACRPARPALEAEAGGGQRPARLAGDGVGGALKAGGRTGRDQGHQRVGPHVRVHGGRETVEEPGVGAAAPGFESAAAASPSPRRPGWPRAPGQLDAVEAPAAAGPWSQQRRGDTQPGPARPSARGWRPRRRAVRPPPRRSTAGRPAGGERAIARAAPGC